jgi:hypothetical protein
MLLSTNVAYSLWFVLGKYKHRDEYVFYMNVNKEFYYSQLSINRCNGGKEVMDNLKSQIKQN